jgi:hypothetical protein
LLADIRKLWSGTLISNLWDRPRSEIGVEVATGLADLEAYGQTVLANPDFVERLKSGAPDVRCDSRYLLRRRRTGVCRLPRAERSRGGLKEGVGRAEHAVGMLRRRLILHGTSSDERGDPYWMFTRSGPPAVTTNPAATILFIRNSTNTVTARGS